MHSHENRFPLLIAFQIIFARYYFTPVFTFDAATTPDAAAAFDAATPPFSPPPD
jgi:hypothetical protein